MQKSKIERLIVTVTPKIPQRIRVITSEITHPMSAPIQVTIKDSLRNSKTIWDLEAPIAFLIPISFVRSDTLTIMTFIIPSPATNKEIAAIAPKTEEIIFKIPSKHAVNVAKSIDKLERKYKAEFKDKFKTITFDNGGEFRDYKALEKSYDKRKKEPRVQVYYAHPYRSGERGSNENANRLIRRFIPKGTVITDISEEFIQQVEDWINNLLRPMFGFKSSLEMAKIVS